MKRKSPPVRGAWIEIFGDFGDIPDFRVASREGGVD